MLSKLANVGGREASCRIDGMLEEARDEENNDQKDNDR